MKPTTIPNRLPLLVLFVALLLALAGCETPENTASKSPEIVLAIAIDPTVSGTLDRIKAHWEPIFKTAVQHHIPVLIVRAAEGLQPIRFAGNATRADELTTALQTASEPAPASGSPLYPAAQTLCEWLAKPEFKNATKVAVFASDTINDPRKVNGSTREAYKSLFDADFRTLSNLKIHFLGVPAERAVDVRSNIPTADVVIEGAEADAMNPAHFGLPELEEDEI